MAKKGMTKREQQRQETRRKVYDTSMDLFTRKGYASVTVEEICNKAGVSKGTFYYYFKSKHEVLMEEYFKIDLFLPVIVDEAYDKYKSSTDRLAEVTTGSLRYIRDQMGVNIAKVIYHSEINPEKKKSRLSSRKRPTYPIVEKLVREGQKQGEFRDDFSPEEISENWFRCFRGVLYEWCLANGGFDLVQAGELFNRLIIEGMKKP